MKKTMASLALLGLATLAFGQDAAKPAADAAAVAAPAKVAAPAPALVLNGYIDTGVTYLGNSESAGVVGLWGDDSKVQGGQVRLLGTYNNGDAGVTFDLRYDGSLNTADTTKSWDQSTSSRYLPYFKSGYVWANFLNKVVYTQVGVVKDQATATGGDKNFKFSSETPGAVVDVKPVDGLVLSAFVQPKGDFTTNIVTVSNLLAAGSFAYTAPNLARVSAGASVANTNKAENNYHLNEIYAGVNLNAVPNLAATVEYDISGLNDGKKKGYNILSQLVSYNFKDQGLSALTAKFVAYQYWWGKDFTSKTNEKPDLSLRLQPSATYALDSYTTFGLNLAYITGWAVTELKTNAYSYDLESSTTLSSGKGGSYAVPTSLNNTKIDKNAIIDIKPSVAFNVAKGQVVTFSYGYTLSVGEQDVLFLTTKKDATSLHSLQANYTYKF